MNEQIVVFATLVSVLIMFAWGRWRYDIVAVIAMLIITVTGIIPYEEAFYGFSHPAVITVAAVLIISRALMNSGVVDLASRKLSAVNHNQILRMAYLVGGVALCSAFMNNVGALALFMPVAIRIAQKNKQSPSTLLMPLAFGSLLGGLITQVGTPPNIIISMFRAETDAAVSFGMFDFAPVGLGVTIVGVLFIILVGWRLIPCRVGKVAAEDLFSIDSYLTEVVIPAGSKFAKKRLLDLGQATGGDITVVGHVRNKRKLPFLSPYRSFEEEDQIIIKANAEDLQEFLDVTGFQLTATKKISKEDLSSDEVTIVEAVVTVGSLMDKQTARSLELRSIYGINLLGISREGTRLSERPDRVRFRPGDVLLLQGRREALSEVMSTLGCLPLVERGLQIGKPRRLLSGTLIFIGYRDGNLWPFTDPDCFYRGCSSHAADWVSIAA
jgi:di/tricarboxylate transporter